MLEIFDQLVGHGLWVNSPFCRYWLRAHSGSRNNCWIFCIAHWNCISVSVHVIFYFEVLLAFMFIFETENRIKLSSHNTGQINHPISFLFKKPITSWFWMLHEKHRLNFSYGTTSLGEPLLTAIPKQLVKDPEYFGCKICLAVLAKQSVMFSLELNHDTQSVTK